MDAERGQFAVVVGQPGQQGEPGAVRPAERAVQLVRGSAALGDGQLVAQREEFDVLGRGILA